MAGAESHGNRDPHQADPATDRSAGADRTATEGVQEFEVDPLVRFGPLLGLPIVLVFAFAVLGSGVLANNEVGPIVALFIVVALGALGFEALWRPYRVLVRGDGLLLVAAARKVTIDWAELESVTRSRAFNGTMRWCCTSGLRVTTSDRIMGLHRLLTEIERRAPHVRVLS